MEVTYLLPCGGWELTKMLTQNGGHLVEDIFISIFLNKNKLSLIKISLKFVSKNLIINKELAFL